MARELDDAILSLRTNELDLGLWIIKTAGNPDAKGVGTLTGDGGVSSKKPSGAPAHAVARRPSARAWRSAITRSSTI